MLVPYVDAYVAHFTSFLCFLFVLACACAYVAIVRTWLDEKRFTKYSKNKLHVLLREEIETSSKLFFISFQTRKVQSGQQKQLKPARAGA